MLKDEMVGERGNHIDGTDLIALTKTSAVTIKPQHYICKQQIVESAERSIWVAGGLEQDAEDAASCISDTPVERNVVAFLGSQLALGILNKVVMLLRIWEVLKQ